MSEYPARISIGDRAMSRVVNPVVRRLLRSPVHDLISGSTVLVGVKGRRTGIWREVAANYHADGPVLTLVSRPGRTWWRNVDGGQPVRAVLGGIERTGTGEVDVRGGVVRIRITLNPAPQVATPVHGRQLWGTWFRATTFGEVVGFGVPAVVAPLVAGVGLWFVELPVIVVAGAAEGALLGLGQAYALRRALPQIRTRDWVRATAAGAALAWLIGMAPAVVGQRLWDQSPPLAVALAVLAGVLLIGSIGVLQWRVLRGHVPHAGRWVAAMAGAWLAGLLAFATVAMPLWHEGQPAVLIVAIGVLGGLVMATTVAAITGLALVRLLPPPAQGVSSKSMPYCAGPRQRPTALSAWPDTTPVSGHTSALPDAVWHPARDGRDSEDTP